MFVLSILLGFVALLLQTYDLSFFLVIIVVFMFGYGITSRSLMTNGNVSLSARQFIYKVIFPVYYFVHGSFDNERLSLEGTRISCRKVNRSPSVFSPISFSSQSGYQCIRSDKNNVCYSHAFRQYPVDEFINRSVQVCQIERINRTIDFNLVSPSMTFKLRHSMYGPMIVVKLYVFITNDQLCFHRSLSHLNDTMCSMVLEKTRQKSL